MESPGRHRLEDSREDAGGVQFELSDACLSCLIVMVKRRQTELSASLQQIYQDIGYWHIDAGLNDADLPSPDTIAMSLNILMLKALVIGIDQRPGRPVFGHTYTLTNPTTAQELIRNEIKKRRIDFWQIGISLLK